jgi:hypothetical protein
VAASTVEEWTRALTRELRLPEGCEGEVLPFADAGDDAPVAVDAPGPYSSTLTIRLGDDEPATPDTGPDGEQPPGAQAVLRSGDGSFTAIAFSLPMTPGDALAHLADRLQDAILEDTHGVPAVACPGGEDPPHPPNAELVADVTCRVCPRTRATRPVLPGPAA